ncbi:histidine kinase dimerization/phospho-acceptor domain-containing protein [Pseudoduganella lurida]|nr:histidine kinase dimerization/phospho-acceptor domain-containing protein [Pseudoduganella lurida]
MYNIPLSTEFDVFAARQRAVQIAGICGFTSLNQIRLGTIVSDLARDLIQSGSGTVRFALRGVMPAASLEIAIRQDSDGPQPQQWSARHSAGAARQAQSWSDQFHLDLSAGGAGIVFSRRCPPGAELTLESFERQAGALASLPADVALARALLRNDALEGEVTGLTASRTALQGRFDVLEGASRAMGERYEALEDASRLMAERYDALGLRADAALLADARKGEFLAILAHELRSPLAAAGAAAEVLTNAPAIEREQLRRIGQMI